MKRYWTTLKALEGDPEFAANLPREFPSPPEKSPPTELQRREFLKLMGAGFMLGTLGCVRRPAEKIIPYVNQPIEVTPGVANWYTSTCGGCASGCGLLVKTREGRPIKLEGNPDHPVNRGGLCARGQASLLGLYDPDRLRAPVRIERRSGTSAPTDWRVADAEITAALDTVRAEGRKVVVLSGTLISPATRQLIQNFLAGFPAGEHVSVDATEPEEVAEAQALCYGERVLPRYRFDRAEVVVSFGADFLGTWLSPVEFAKDFAHARRVDAGRLSQLITFAGRVSLTGTNADVYQPVRPGEEIFVALALAHELIVTMGVGPFAGDAALMQALRPFAVGAVAAHTGVSAAILKTTARRLWKNNGKGLVVGGDIKCANAVALQVVVNLLNTILGNDGTTVDGSIAPHRAESTFAAVRTLIADMAAGTVGAVILHQTDPLFMLPPAAGFAAALAHVPLVISTAERITATAAAADWVCPDAHALESWNDANPRRGVFSITQPTVAPLFSTRQFQESLIRWGKLSTSSWHDYLRAHWVSTVRAAVGSGLAPTAFWETALQQGYVGGGEVAAAAEAPGIPRSFAMTALAVVPTALPQSSTALRLALYPSVTQGDGRFANNGWLQELPDPVTKACWGNYLSIAPKTAHRLGLTDGDVVRVRAGAASVELPIHRQPKLHEGAAAVAVGYGQTGIGVIGSGVGVNVFPLQGLNGLPVWSGAEITLEKTGAVDPIAFMQEYNAIDGRPILQDITLDEFRQNPAAGGTKAPAIPTLWPEHQYPGHKWGMAIDLTTCIGCHACVIGCQSENNIPVVGKEQVIRNRDMHWIRIDRYYSGDAANPDVAYQPMLCQHCDNAPCETVCPVLATVHNAEGLNIQAYNRCVGTRYCANNCPYKVRRFNYFEYTKALVEPMEQVLNPDVAVRSRGVMEKCTFCVQRIKEVKGIAKDEGRALRAGEVKTACQQSCPTDAISFGDLHNDTEPVAQLRRSPRGFFVLEELNVKPNITYLTKVRHQ